jgi:hypothetical protein
MITNKFSRGFMMAAYFALIGLIYPALVFAEGSAAKILKPDDYLKVMRAIILAEKTIISEDAVDVALSSSCPAESTSGTPACRDTDDVIKSPSGPLMPQIAEDRCGDVQERLAYFLNLEGVPQSQLHFYQSQDDQTGWGFLAQYASPHWVLVYQTQDKNGQEIHLFLDATYLQFTASVNEMKKSPIGSEIVSEIYQEGLWIASSQAVLDTYASNFMKMPDMVTAGQSIFLDNGHHPLLLNALDRDYPTLSPSDRASRFTTQTDHAGINDVQTLSALNAITQTEIDARVAAGIKALGSNN